MDSKHDMRVDKNQQIGEKKKSPHSVYFSLKHIKVVSPHSATAPLYYRSSNCEAVYQIIMKKTNVLAKNCFKLHYDDRKAWNWILFYPFYVFPEILTTIWSSSKLRYSISFSNSIF